MKEHLSELVRGAPSATESRTVAREYLQARILGQLQRAGAMSPLAFHGGTALRFLYATPRYSEDLDFALERDRSRYDFRAYLRAIERQLAAEGYALQIKVSDRTIVHHAFVRFIGLPYDLGLSPHRNEVLSIKIEVDTNPPAGAGLSTTVVRRHVTLHLHHHDRASLLAGKLHAILHRPYTKGRDIYDLLWYLSDPDWPEPNLTLLNHAVRQTGPEGAYPTGENWRELVAERLQEVAWDKAVDDVRPFLDRTADLDLLTQENVMRLLSQGPGTPSRR